MSSDKHENDCDKEFSHTEGDKVLKDEKAPVSKFSCSREELQEIARKGSELLANASEEDIEVLCQWKEH